MKKKLTDQAKILVEIAGVTLSHPEKSYFPAAKISKNILADYYHQHSQWILPHLLHRPLAIIRCPEGVGHPCFYQKHIETLPNLWVVY